MSTRERILGEARRLFGERGWKGATTAEIARRAGVAEGTIYRHFKGKKELLIACVEPAVEAALERGLAAIARARSTREVIRILLQARWQMIEENRDVFNILFTESPYQPELAELFFDRAVSLRADKVLSVLQRLAARGSVLRLPDPLIMGPGLTAAMWIMINFRDRAPAMFRGLPFAVAGGQDLLAGLTDLVLYGVAGQPAGGA